MGQASVLRAHARYLSAEQRLNYLVKVDKDGLLRWCVAGDVISS